MSEQSYVPLAVGEGYFSDWQSPSIADDGKTWVWNHAQQKYVPQALSAGVTDHALLTHLDFASSGHTGFEQAGAGAAAVATHVALDDPHDQYLLESAYTAADVFAKVLTQDGSGSGLDADLLDGNSSAAFATAGHSHTIAHGSLTGLSNDDHTQYLLASGSRNGAASQAQTFTSGVKANSVQTLDDSQGFKVRSSNGTLGFVVDTNHIESSNVVYVGIGVATSPDSVLTLQSPNSGQYILGYKQASNKVVWENWIEDGGYGGGQRLNLL